ncbi:2-amino-4-hydroxy-6-hydroxymethyldihydropteridine diphosphokinase [Haliea sp.]|uniref:2-amino-4-hydroxy-6- hydroxymethyldihydropteridine diphosphokinase n=1 Tax=Haliea sp. TaxID=1932666 RepID=UPI003528C0A5
MPDACIALGSNLGDPARQLQIAVDAIRRLPGTHITAGSGVYASAAVGPGQQPDYLNAVLMVRTALGPLPLLNALQDIERAQGRERTVRWGPRTLDLDILLYGAEQIRLPRLQVPHPGMAERHFVLYPLLDIYPDGLVVPGLGSLATLLAQCPATGLTRSAVTLDYHLQDTREPGP